MQNITEPAPISAIEYNRSKYNPSRGGRAPGHLRDEFKELVYEDSDAATEQGRLERLCGLLWNCSQIMPSALCDYLDLPSGSTFAKGARYLKSGEAPNLA
jgi:hypothetical protein